MKMTDRITKSFTLTKDENILLEDSVKAGIERKGISYNCSEFIREAIKEKAENDKKR